MVEVAAATVVIATASKRQKGEQQVGEGAAAR